MAEEEGEMIQKLPDDIIIEIITRLPLKYAARCRSLSKYIYNNISIPKLLSSINPIIFPQGLGDWTTTISSPFRTATLPNNVTLIDSCNGILFLRCHWYRNKFCVFNPLTGGIKLFFDHDINNHEHYPSLAVMNPSSSSSSSSFDFKLVDLHSETLENPVRNCLQFCVYNNVPSRKSTKLVKKYLYLEYQGSLWDHWTGHHRPVYSHGCLHWLRSGYTAIAAFDMESERPRIIDGPLGNIATRYDDWDYRTWFGLAQSSLQFIRIDDRNRIIIVHSHDYVTEEWRVAHKIEIPNYISRNRRMRMMVQFFDGHNVLCKVLKEASCRGVKIEDIYVHDLSIGEWNKIGQVENGYGNFYMEFIPTTARVSDSYMWSKKSAQLRSTLVGLQQILLGGHDS